MAFTTDQHVYALRAFFATHLAAVGVMNDGAQNPNTANYQPMLAQRAAAAAAAVAQGLDVATAATLSAAIAADVQMARQTIAPKPR